jgi:putative lipoprotein
MAEVRSLLVLVIVLIAGQARADPSDPFWGRDKALHFVAGGAIAGAAYGITTAVTDDRWKAFAVGAGAALGAGAIKEGLDATGMGDPSWKDFAWDAIGAACGLGVAWLVDSAVRGGPPSLVNRTSAPLRGTTVLLRF